jgi:hypothetical protein
MSILILEQVARVVLRSSSSSLHPHLGGLVIEPLWLQPHSSKLAYE